MLRRTLLIAAICTPVPALGAVGLCPDGTFRELPCQSQGEAGRAKPASSKWSTDGVVKTPTDDRKNDYLYAIDLSSIQNRRDAIYLWGRSDAAKPLFDFLTRRNGWTQQRPPSDIEIKRAVDRYYESDRLVATAYYFMRVRCASRQIEILERLRYNEAKLVSSELEPSGYSDSAPGTLGAYVVQVACAPPQ